MLAAQNSFLSKAGKPGKSGSKSGKSGSSRPFTKFCEVIENKTAFIFVFCRQIRLERELKSLLWKIDYSEIVLGRSYLEYFGTQSEEDPPLSVRRRLIIVGITRVRLVQNKGQEERQSKGRVRIWDVGDR